MRLWATATVPRSHVECRGAARTHEVDYGLQAKRRMANHQSDALRGGSICPGSAAREHSVSATPRAISRAISRLDLGYVSAGSAATQARTAATLFAWHASRMGLQRRRSLRRSSSLRFSPSARSSPTTCTGSAALSDHYPTLPRPAAAARPRRCRQPRPPSREREVSRKCLGSAQEVSGKCLGGALVVGQHAREGAAVPANLLLHDVHRGVAARHVVYLACLTCPNVSAPDWRLSSS